LQHNVNAVKNEEESIERNKSLGKIPSFFGLTPGMAFAISAFSSICAVLAYIEIIPLSLVFATWCVVNLSMLIVFNDGFGRAFARYRKPKQYSRGNYRYRSPLDRHSKKHGRSK
jgi:hypothetical protein